MSAEIPSEFNLIEWIRRNSQQFPASLLKSIGDDCAVFDPGFARALAVTADVLAENVHFRREWISPSFLGRKSLAVTLSDLAATGARPYACLLALSVPAGTTTEYFHAFMEGFLEETQRWNTPVIGGDLSASGLIHVSVTAWGWISTGNPIYRSGAREQDRIVLAGDVGLSRLGLEAISQEGSAELSTISDDKALADWADDPFRFRCLKAHLLPEPRIEIGVWLQEHQLANAMIDISDGLMSDLLHVARESRLAAELDVHCLPVPAEVADRKLALDVTLNGGEDYALLFTVSAEQLEHLRSSYPSQFPAFRVIGRMTKGEPSVYLVQQGTREKYEPRGFDHFRTQPLTHDH